MTLLRHQVSQKELDYLFFVKRNLRRGNKSVKLQASLTKETNHVRPRKSQPKSKNRSSRA
jgi:hypothetical protein